MTDFKGFKGRAETLTDFDLPRIAHRIRVGEDELHAFLDVETNGKAFDAQGRPRILFEPHVFYRNLSGDKRTRAVSAGLAARKWGAIKYGRTSAQYDRLNRAIVIDESAALKACSWGSTQILGENYKMVGYASPQDMVLAFMDDEDSHVEAAVEFIISAGIDDEMRDLAALTRPTRAADCVAIVSVYNGPGYKKNDYHTKFARRHNWWRGIPDTPWEPDQDIDEDDPILDPPEHSLNEREQLQTDLHDLGYYDGAIDGIIGPKTKQAVREFQRAYDLVVDGIVGPSTRPALAQAALRHRALQAAVRPPQARPDAVNGASPDASASGLVRLLRAIVSALFPNRG